MAVTDIVTILKEFDGHASIKEIKHQLRLKFPNYSFAEYVSRDLRKLRQYGKIEFNETTREWYLL